MRLDVQDSGIGQSVWGEVLLCPRRQTGRGRCAPRCPGLEGGMGVAATAGSRLEFSSSPGVGWAKSLEQTRVTGHRPKLGGPQAIPSTQALYTYTPKKEPPATVQEAVDRGLQTVGKSFPQRLSSGSSVWGPLRQPGGSWPAVGPNLLGSASRRPEPTSRGLETECQSHSRPCQGCC